MPAIRPRKNKDGEVISYEIRVHRGRAADGTQLKPYTMTYKPREGMTPKQITKRSESVYLCNNILYAPDKGVYATTLKTGEKSRVALNSHPTFVNRHGIRRNSE